MSTLHRFILAIALAAGIAPAFSAAPPPVPALPDTERRTTYSITSSTCACAVNFALYGDSTDYQNWVEVWVNGVQVSYNDVINGWTITSPSNADLSKIARPITDAVLTFNSPQTGTVQIVGARRPRRTSQFNENRGVSARDLNQALTDIVAQNRETWDKTNDATGRGLFFAPGNSTGPMPSPTACANGILGFDATGKNPICLPAGTGVGLTNVDAGGATNVTNGVNGGLLYNNNGKVGTSPLTTLLNSACSLSPSTCIAFFGYANPVWYGADPLGVADSAAAWNSATAASSMVIPSPGTYRIAASIVMHPGGRISCPAGTTITQGTAQNLLVFFDFYSIPATGAQLDHCIIDGNRANNTDNDNALFVDISTTSDVKIVDNTIQNIPGSAISTAGQRTVIQNNTISNCYQICIGIVGVSPGAALFAQVHGNRVLGSSAHAIYAFQSDHNDISNNVLIPGVAIGGAGSSMVVTVVGTTATWVSGTNFAGVSAGMFLVAGGGFEFQIAAVNSNTSLTLASSGSLTNVAAAIGAGDVLSLTNVSFNRIQGNFIFGGVTGGVVLSNESSSTENVGSNQILGNYVFDSGAFCYAIDGNGAFSNTVVSDTQLIGNYCVAPGRNSPGGAAVAGIELFASPGRVNGVHIADNYILDPFTLAGGYWLTSFGQNNATNVTFGKNTVKGFANGYNMNGYPTFASLPVLALGYSGWIIDGNGPNCGDNTCQTFGTIVTGGGGALPLMVWNKGTGWTLAGK